MKAHRAAIPSRFLMPTLSLQMAAPWKATSERNASTDLCRKWNSNRCSGPKKVAQRAASYPQLIRTADRLGRRARRIHANVRHIARLCFGARNRKGRNVGYVIRARIIPVEQVEELDKRNYRPALAQRQRPADPQIRLNVWSATELIQHRRCSVDRDSPAVVRRGNGERPRRFGLCQRAQLYAANCPPNAGKHKPLPNIFARWAIITRPKRIQRIADAVHVIEQLTQDAAPSLRLRKRVIRHQAHSPSNIALQMHEQPVVTRTVVRV